MSLDIATKYDRIAERFAETSYANVDFDMQHRFRLAMSWGVSVQRGDSVLELGCGDGYLAQVFAEHGVCYQGVDISPNMVAVAERRLRAAKLEGEFRVTDINESAMFEPVDAVVSYMGTFFTYIKDPLAVLRQLRPAVRKKIILDLNPRGEVSFQKAAEMMRDSGFCEIDWRPFLVPKEKKLPIPVLKILCACEDVPLLRSLPLRWKFNILIKGEAG